MLYLQHDLYLLLYNVHACIVFDLSSPQCVLARVQIVGPRYPALRRGDTIAWTHLIKAVQPFGGVIALLKDNYPALRWGDSFLIHSG